MTYRQLESIERDILKRVDASGNRINLYTVIGKSRRREWKTAQVLRSLLSRGVLVHKDFKGLEIGRP
ncbi:MAG TPA: hypothetical protein VMO76_14845 [Candidatus Udaeobacter sp.]|nr:hypothetical protein [Candidatus Udaeobacter sp.]